MSFIEEKQYLADLLVSFHEKILFLTGTRADFGKLKSLIQAVKEAADFEYRIFATGMHLLSKYGMTVIEIEKCGFKPIHRFENQTSEAAMDMSLAKTIEGFSAYVKKSSLILLLYMVTVQKPLPVQL